MSSSAPLSAVTPPKLLVLGGNGRIGRLLARCWHGDATLRPIWTVRPSAAAPKELAQNLRRLDILGDPSGLEHLCRGMDVVIVLAGVTPSGGNAAPDYALNIALAQAALTAARAAQVPRVFLASSAAGYGGGAQLSETSPTQPVNAYGQAKLEMEALGRGQPGVTALRIGNVAGADQLLGPGRRAVSLDVFADGRGPVRSYLGPKTLARILGDLIRHPGPLPACLNITAPAPVDMAALLRAADIDFTPRQAPEGLPSEVALTSTLLSQYAPLVPDDSAPETIAAEWLEITGGAPI